MYDAFVLVQIAQSKNNLKHSTGQHRYTVVTI